MEENAHISSICQSPLKYSLSLETLVIHRLNPMRCLPKLPVELEEIEATLQEIMPPLFFMQIRHEEIKS